MKFLFAHEATFALSIYEMRTINIKIDQSNVYFDKIDFNFFYVDNTKADIEYVYLRKSSTLSIIIDFRYIL